MSAFPRQKISSTEKKRKDPVSKLTWGEQCVDFISDEFISSTFNNNVNSDARLLDGGEPIKEDYEYVLNPLNTTVDRYKRFGARLRNFDIITPVRDLYVGEFSKRYKNFTVIDSNPEDENTYKKGLSDLLEQYYSQKLVNELNAIGIETGKETQEQGTVQETVNNYNKDFDSNRVITGQEILDYIKFDQDLDEKYQQAYTDWVSFGATVTYKGIFHNDVTLENVPPYEISLPNSFRGNFIEDAPRILRRQVMTGNQIVDRWRHVLSDDDISWLEEMENGEIGTGASGTSFVVLPTEWIGKDDKYYSQNAYLNGFEVCHTQWRSYAKVGILTYINEMGVTTEMEVDDTYKFNEANGDISIEWEWISEVWEGWRIGDSSRKIFVDVRPLPYNRMELNNSSAQKLSYNGRINRGVNGKIVSIPGVGKPYQILYNILKYQFEKVINKNKDKIMVIPQGIMPKGVGGWDEEKMMYYAHADSMLVIDETQPTAGIALQGIKVLDMSLGQFAKDSIELMNAVKYEFWEAIGMNRQRYGDSKASDGKAVTEQAIFRSAIISEELNRKFEKFQEKDYAGLLDISKVAYLEGKKSQYVNSDGRQAFIKLNVDDAIFHLESDYNVHVINSAQETENIRMAKEYGFSLGQNADAPTMMELIGSNNFEKTKRIVYKIDAISKQIEQATQERTLATQEYVAQMAQETKQAENDVEIYKADKDYNKVIDAKILELSKEDGDTSDKGIKEKLANHKVQNDKDIVQINREKLAEDKKLTQQKIKESNAKIYALKHPPKTTTSK